MQKLSQQLVFMGYMPALLESYIPVMIRDRSGFQFMEGFSVFNRG